MKDFIDSYVVPVGRMFLIFFFIPAIMLGGVRYACHLTGNSPNTGICQEVQK
jgi:hypothetical protein